MDSFTLDSIICPACEAELPAKATSCDHCGANTAAPSALADGQDGRSATADGEKDSPGAQPARLADRPWIIAIVLLHLGIFGATWYWKLNHSREVRIALVVVSFFYTLFVAIVVYWGLRQIGHVIESLS